MKKLLTVFILAVVVLGMTVTCSAAPTVMLDGVTLEFDVEPEITNGRTMVPFRKLFETFGFAINWDESTNTILAIQTDFELAGKTIVLQIGNSNAYVENTVQALDVAPYIKDGYTLVPLRFVAENSGANVEWIEQQQLVKITTNK